jgi:8-oxo-dGTP diphosphatase
MFMNEVFIQPQRFKLVSAVHLFLITDQRILLARRFQTGFADGLYSVPAGHLDGGETPRQAMIREAQEEVCVKINEKDLEFAHVMHRITDRESTDFFFFCRRWQGEPTIGEPDKCDDLSWFDLNNLPENTVPYIRVAIEQSMAHQMYGELKV